MALSYTEITQAKTGFKIPLKGSISVCSKYDPEKEAEVFAAQFSNDDLFFITGGLASGLHIKKLIDVNPDRKIITVENNDEDFDFLQQIPLCKNLIENNKIITATPQTLYNIIINSYLPSIYGKLTLTFLRGWENAFTQTALVIKEIVNTVLTDIKADYSVQARFGKIWQKNIFENLAVSSGRDFNSIIKKIRKNNTKTAAVIATGPSLDDSLKKIKDERNKYFIFTTDTAFSTLLKNGITPDVAVTIDGQMISHTHFMHTLPENSEIIYAMDLCASSLVSKNLALKSSDLLFFESGHPLAVLASRFSGESFIHLEAGAGTVTVSAMDLARKTGFKDIEYFGADFSYSNSKPYAKGTYLDTLYSKNADRLKGVEQNFSKLMLRTSLIKNEQGIPSTQVLQNYRKSLEYLKTSPFTPVKENLKTFNFNDFYSVYKDQINSLNDLYLENLTNPYFYTLLPLMSFYENTFTPQESCELARTKSVRYN